MQSHSKCGLAIVLLHCCFLSCSNRPYICIFVLILIFIVRSFIGGERALSLNFLFSILVCVVYNILETFALEIRPSPRFLLPKFNSVQGIFLKFHPSPHLSVLYSLSYSFIALSPMCSDPSFLLLSLSSHFFFTSSHEFLSHSLCIQSDCLPTERNERRKGPKTNQRRNNNRHNNNDHFRHNIHSHLLYLSSRST